MWSEMINYRLQLLNLYFVTPNRDKSRFETNKRIKFTCFNNAFRSVLIFWETSLGSNDRMT